MASNQLLGLEATSSIASSSSSNNESDRWTAKPHPFSGAVLSPKHARELTPSACLAIASALRDHHNHHHHQRRVLIPYTLWITEAWGVLGWAEPSAALFWEMATMYHTLYLAGREDGNNGGNSADDNAKIPPILSCGSHSSLGSSGGNAAGASPMDTSTNKKKQYSTAASAKELPVWMVSSFLLLHCEESAYLRNLSSSDDRRFSPNTTKLDFDSLLQQKHSSLSPRTRMHAGSWRQYHLHCISYLLRHLRKILLLTAAPHNDDAMRACMHLARLPPLPTNDPNSSALHNNNLFSVEWLDKTHTEEHGKLGMTVRLTLADLERLHFVLQPPSGGSVDDPSVDIANYLWGVIYPSIPIPSNATIPLGEVEHELRHHLREELLRQKGSLSESAVDDDGSTSEAAEAALAKLSLEERSPSSKRRGYHKELTYANLRGTTVVLKPTPSDSPRLHDLVIAECSDVHFYLLRPFEHVTIAACTGCSVVVGAVAGLLHVVDCEKTQVTSAVRRLLVSNSADVLNYVFTPSPPLLVGDNRNCQLAPYNTYYDGLREDLLSTGLAAAVSTTSAATSSESSVSSTPPAAAISSSAANNTNSNQLNSPSWPPLQCASNKWKQPVELSKLEIPPVGGTETSSESGGVGPANPNSNNNSNSSASGGGSGGAGGAGSPTSGGNKTDDAAMQTPILLPPSDFHILYCPVITSNFPFQDSSTNNADEIMGEQAEEAPYCKVLTQVLQCSPFRLPLEYERQALVKTDRMKSLQDLVRKTLTDEQQKRFAEELNRGFRDWLVSSGNLRQVLDLVHMENKQLA